MRVVACGRNAVQVVIRECLISTAVPSILNREDVAIILSGRGVGVAKELLSVAYI
jgi:hypothetical protein